MKTSRYAEADHLDDMLRDLLASCPHTHKPFSSMFGKTEVRYCMDCDRASRPMRDAVRAAYKAARKRELADLPRCEYCNRRGQWRCGAGPNRPLLCGAHLKIAKQYATGGMFHTFTGPDVRAILDGVLELERAKP